MGRQGLGLDTVYFEGNKLKTARCLYLTAGKYTFEGAHADMANVKGCQERPSSLHSTGMDDGAAESAKYGQFKFSGKLRLAGYKDGRKMDYHPDAGFKTQLPCQAEIKDRNTLKRLQEQWKFLLHNGAVQHSSWSSILWDTNFPKNECIDFPGESSTLGLRKGRLIDLPRQVRARAVCSIIFFQECENRMAVEKKSPCGDKKTPIDQLPMFECKSTKTFQPATKGVFTCDCPEQHQKIGDECKWNTDGDNGKFGCWIRFIVDGAIKSLRIGVHEKRDLAFGGQDPNEYLPDFGPEDNTWNDKADRAVVRDGCRLKVFGSSLSWPYQFTLLEDVAYGTYHVPNKYDGSLGGANTGMGASAAECQCPKL